MVTLVAMVMMYVVFTVVAMTTFIAVITSVATVTLVAMVIHVDKTFKTLQRVLVVDCWFKHAAVLHT